MPSRIPKLWHRRRPVDPPSHSALQDLLTQMRTTSAKTLRAVERGRVRRPAAVPSGGSLPAGVSVDYETFNDPTTADHELTRAESEGQVPRHVHGGERVRLYLRAKIDGREVGHLSAWLYPSNTALVRKIQVSEDFRRRKVASALYETFRAEYPDVFVDHGIQWPDGAAWWNAYCVERGLDPRDPRS